MAELEKTNPVSLFKTKTFYGVLLAVLAIFLPRYGGILTSPETIDFVQEVVGMIGAGIAIYGRLHAQRKASISPPALPSPPAEPPGKDEIGAPPAATVEGDAPPK